MGVRVWAASPESVELRAPLGPNINHQDTVFGGSASAVAILSAWALIHVRLKAQSMNGRIVIYRNAMLYESPITDAFSAVATIPDEAVWPRLVAALNRNRMARIAVPSTLFCDGRKVGQFEGEFVVLPETARHGM